jgi:hypothetical protein
MLSGTEADSATLHAFQKHAASLHGECLKGRDPRSLSLREW